MRKRLSQWGFLLPLPFVVTLLCGLTSVSETLWSDELHISGNVETGSWGCTLTIGYWHNHPEKWPINEVSLGDISYTQRQARQILGMLPEDDATHILAQQLIGAKLNIPNGASSTQIADTISAADAFLTQYPLGSDPGEVARDEGTTIANRLAAYNEGLLWPSHCDWLESPFEEIEYEPSTEESTATQEPTEIPTEEPTEIPDPTEERTQDSTETQEANEEPTMEPTEEPIETQEPTEELSQEPVEIQEPPQTEESVQPLSALGQ